MRSARGPITRVDTRAPFASALSSGAQPDMSRR